MALPRGYGLAAPADQKGPTDEWTGVCPPIHLDGHRRCYGVPTLRHSWRPSGGCDWRRGGESVTAGAMVRRVVASAAIASLVAAATACTSSSPPSASPSASVSATVIASVPADPFGSYFAKIPSGLNAEPGTWTLVIGPDELRFYRPDGQTFTPGTLDEITETEIVLSPDPGCTVQQGTATEGRYRWSREADALSLEVVSDSCQDRIDTLTSSEWSLNR